MLGRNAGICAESRDCAAQGLRRVGAGWSIWLQDGYTAIFAVRQQIEISFIHQVAGGLGFEPRLAESESAA